MILIVFLIVLGVIIVSTGLPSKMTESWLTGLVRKWAASSGVAANLIYGIVMTESSGNPNAETPSDPSVGLMGVTPLIGRAYAGLSGSDDEVLAALRSPDMNMAAGSRFLKHLQSKYAVRYPFPLWVQAYNVGETKFDAGIRNQTYASRVALFAGQWKE